MTKFPLVANWDSHILYAIFFGAAFLVMITLNGFESVVRAGLKGSHFGRNKR
jgi:hypothetical protein